MNWKVWQLQKRKPPSEEAEELIQALEFKGEAIWQRRDKANLNLLKLCCFESEVVQLEDNNAADFAVYQLSSQTSKDFCYDVVLYYWFKRMDSIRRLSNLYI